ncbi:MAG: cytochrome d ubiquinol oxidase subunit II [Desulfobacterales bacterium]|nr:MAG: cytochrome d ubiquinol oxidase subunit II [Desulfobacterales bacterium]
MWDHAFHFGSLVATFSQGVVLGGLVQGIAVQGRSFAGGAFDWLTALSVMTGLALVCGYALLGSTWLIMKTEDDTQDWARKCAAYVLVLVAIFMGLVSLSMPFMNADLEQLWFSWPNSSCCHPCRFFPSALWCCCGAIFAPCANTGRFS